MKTWIEWTYKVLVHERVEIAQLNYIYNFTIYRLFLCTQSIGHKKIKEASAENRKIVEIYRSPLLQLQLLIFETPNHKSHTIRHITCPLQLYYCLYCRGLAACTVLLS